MNKIIVAIGGGSIKEKTTLSVDAFIASLVKENIKERRANALFFPTASHDSLPYFNSFRKIYTSHFDIKCDVALLTKKDIPLEKIKQKIDAADMIYVGGGNTAFMLKVWQKTGVDKMLIEAYQNGKILCGISAGAICWFDEFYSDSDILSDIGTDYVVMDGLGLLKGLVTPHYGSRYGDFNDFFNKSTYKSALALEDNCAAIFYNGEFVNAIPSFEKIHFLNK